DFAVKHPEVLLDQGASRPDPSAQRSPRALGPDPTVSLLREEKARIEAELATVDAEAKAGGHDNPYDDVHGPEDIAQLRRRLGEIRNAIVAHQRAMSANETRVRPASAPTEAETEWKRLARAVAEAQTAAFAPRKDPLVVLGARILEAASLPSRPFES